MSGIKQPALDPYKCLLTREETNQFFQSISGNGENHILYRALFGTLLLKGVRATEACRLTLDSLCLEREPPFIRVKRLKKKDETIHMISIPDVLLAYIEAWLKIRGDNPGPLFYRYNRKKDMIVKRAWDRFGLFHLWQDLLKAAGIRHRKLHSTRHTFATNHLKACDGNIRATQKELGHSKMETTAIYADIEMEESVQHANKVAELYGLDAEREDSGAEIIELSEARGKLA